MCFLLGIDRAGEENERKRVKWTGVSTERWSESEEDANRDAGVYMSAGKRGNTIHQSTNNFPWSHCAPSFVFSTRCLGQRWSSRWVTGTVLMCGMKGSTEHAGITVFHLIHLWTHVAHWSWWQWIWQIAFCIELMREKQVCAAPKEMFSVQVWSPQLKLICRLLGCPNYPMMSHK